MKSILIYLKNKTGIDIDILWIIFNKVWSILKGPITILFILKFLCPEEQGLWYTFISLGALSVFAELGFTTIITQFVSHEYANLNEVDGILLGPKEHIERIISLIRFSIYFYIIIIPAAILVLCLVGYIYFGMKIDNTFFAWSVFSIVGGLNLLFSLLQAIYQGLDKVKKTQINILTGSILMALFNWTLLYFNFAIWALTLGNLLGLTIMLILLYYTAPAFWHQIIKFKIENKYNWFHEIINLQWKYAISWASGYFIFFLLIPAVYKYTGKTEAGQLGVAQSMVGAISGIAASWIVSKIPKFNILVAKKQRVQLNTLFIKSSIQGFVLQVSLSIILIIFLFIILKYTTYGNRFLNISMTILIITSQIAQSVINFIAFYLRAHKEEPFVWLSAFNGIVMGALIFFILPKWGLSILLTSINVLLWVIILPLALIIFSKCKRRYLRSIYLDNSNIISQ